VDSFIQILTGSGVAVAILSAIGYGIYRLAVWAAPILEKVANQHIEYLKVSSEAVVSNASVNETNSKVLEALGGEVKVIHNKVDQIHEHMQNRGKTND
jgi:hypothetical protein